MLQSADAYHRTRDTAVLLRSGLNLIQQALSIYSEDLKLVFANRQFKTMFNLPTHLGEPGADFGITLQHLAVSGEYGDVKDVDDFVKGRVEQALTFEPHYLERQRANGDWISIEGCPLRQGGWVTVYTNITEVRQQEGILRSRSDELSGKLLDRSEELASANRALEATINRLHETQQHLEVAEARMRLAAETTPAHIARLNRDEVYTYSNQRLPLTPVNDVRDIVGFTMQEVLGDEIYQLVLPAMRSAFAGEAKVVEFAVPGENRQIRAAFSPETNASGVVTAVYILSMDTSTETVSSNAKPVNSKASFGGWTAHLDRYELTREEEDAIPLTSAETALLRLFLTNPNRLLTREEIFASPNIKRGTERALDVRISRLRQKLMDDPKAPRLLRTIYGAGYIFTADVSWID